MKQLLLFTVVLAMMLFLAGCPWLFDKPDDHPIEVSAEMNSKIIPDFDVLEHILILETYETVEELALQSDKGELSIYSTEIPQNETFTLRFFSESNTEEITLRLFDTLSQEVFLKTFQVELTPLETEEDQTTTSGIYIKKLPLNFYSVEFILAHTFTQRLAILNQLEEEGGYRIIEYLVWEWPEYLQWLHEGNPSPKYLDDIPLDVYIAFNAETEEYFDMFTGEERPSPVVYQDEEVIILKTGQEDITAERYSGPLESEVSGPLYVLQSDSEVTRPVVIEFKDLSLQADEFIIPLTYDETAATFVADGTVSSSGKGIILPHLSLWGYTVKSLSSLTDSTNNYKFTKEALMGAYVEHWISWEGQPGNSSLVDYLKTNGYNITHIMEGTCRYDDVFRPPVLEVPPSQSLLNELSAELVFGMEPSAVRYLTEKVSMFSVKPFNSLVSDLQDLTLLNDTVKDWLNYFKAAGVENFRIQLNVEYFPEWHERKDLGEAMTIAVARIMRAKAQELGLGKVVITCSIPVSAEWSTKHIRQMYVDEEIEVFYLQMYNHSISNKDKLLKEVETWRQKMYGATKDTSSMVLTLPYFGDYSSWHPHFENLLDYSETLKHYIHLEDLGGAAVFIYSLFDEDRGFPLPGDYCPMDDGPVKAFEALFHETGDDFEITFACPNLEQVIREEIEKPTGPIFLSDVHNIRELDARGKGIESLEGIQHLQSLEILDLGRDWDGQDWDAGTVNYISDITPLSNLTNLVWLDLWENSVNDISTLAGLTNLEWLCFGYNSVSDISPLAGLTNLKELYFSNNSVSDISPLVGLTNLELLELGVNLVSDISPLAGLTNLVILNFWLNSVSDISPLGELTNLELLGFGQNQVSDLTPLANLKKLEWLHFGFNLVSDISPLEGLTNLEELGFWYNSVSDISPLSGFANLRRLYFWNNSVRDISPLAGLANLEVLWFEHNSVNDISALVDNEGIASGDCVDIRNNYLDLTPGSQNMQDIQELINRGVNVKYEPQREPGGSAGAFAEYHKDEYFRGFFRLKEEAYRWEMYPPE